MTSILDPLISNRLAKVIRFAYPLLFWGLFFQLVTTLSEPILPRVEFVPWNTLRLIFLAIGGLVLASASIFSFRESVRGLKPFREIQKQVPAIVSEFLRSPSGQSEAIMITRLRELIAQTSSIEDVRRLRMMSHMARLVNRGHLRQLAAFYTTTNLFVYVGSASITIEIYRFLLPTVAPIFDQFKSFSGSPFAILTALFAISFVDFANVVQELRDPSWRAVGKAMRNPALKLLRILEEFTITIRMAMAIDGIIWGFAFWGIYKSNVECPDNTTLRKIIESILAKQLGTSRVFVYKSEDLYRGDLAAIIETLEENLKRWFKSREKVVFIGVCEGNCSLIVSASREDVRRMAIWTQSNVLTDNIVTKCKSEILSYKSYEES